MEREFRDMVVTLSEDLTDTETNKLVYKYSLPRDYKDKQPLVVLELMHGRDFFSSSKPENLAKIMKDLKRVDLAKTVEKHVKKARKSGSKSRATSTESDSSLIQAKCEVTRIQSKITTQVLGQLMKVTSSGGVAETVQKANYNVKNLVDELQCLLQHAQKLHDELLTIQASQPPAGIIDACQILYIVT